MSPQISQQTVTLPDPATQNWVPIWNLNGGINQQYVGAWQTGVTYQPGTVVMSGGIAYLCVRQTTKQPTPWMPQMIMPTYGTTLPANPVDGQEHVLVDSLTNPTYTWRFRYNAQSTSAWKWEFIGGTSLFSEIQASESTSSTSFINLTTVGPSVVIPRAGAYDIDWAANVGNSGANYSIMAIGGAGIGINDADGLRWVVGVAGGDTSIATMRLRALTAGTLTAQYRVTAGTGTWAMRQLRVWPRRVA